MKVLLAFLAVLALPAHAQEAPAWFTETFLDVREDVADAAKDGKRLMLYFWLEGCPYCKELVTVTFNDPAIVGRMKRELVPVAINVRGDREVTWTDGSRMSEKRLTAFLGIRGTPTLVFFDEKGGIALRTTGYLEPKEFSAALERARASTAPTAGPRSASQP